jgi:Cu(I)/Ag(I) efflux system membrane fusion protein
MNLKTFALVLLVVVFAGGGGYALYRLGVDRGMTMAAGNTAASASGPAAKSAPQKASDVEPTAGKKVLYWHDPMAPGQKFDKPGKSPFMDMQLVPVYAESDSDTGTVRISPRVQQNLGVRTAQVKQGTLSTTVQAVGSAAYNERDVALVQARSNGFLERLYVRAPLDPVTQGQPLAELYVPDWVAAQEEYLSAKRISAQAAGKSIDGLVDAARQRMRLAGMSEEQIRRVEATGVVQTRVTLTAPISGVVAELTAREGMTVMAGAPLFRINGLATIWVNAEVPEHVAASVRPGNAVEARAPALPGVTFRGKVSAILPEVNPATRTIKARVELANPGSRLVPGMFATINFAPTARKEVLLVPSEAVIQTGKRSVVVVSQGDGKFVPVDVEVGLDSGGQTEIRKGLQAGQIVVVSGQFLVDSEASLKGTATRMSETGAPQAGQVAGPTHHGEGKVESIGKEEITISHGPIASLQWGPMTMGFKLPASGLPQGVAVGGTVAFEIRQAKDGTFEITSIAPAQANTEAPTDAAAKGVIKKPREGAVSGAKP